MMLTYRTGRYAVVHGFFGLLAKARTSETLLNGQAQQLGSKGAELESDKSGVINVDHSSEHSLATCRTV